MTLQTEGVGYDDLNDLLKNPSDLEFIIGTFNSQQFLYKDNFYQMYTDRVSFVLVSQKLVELERTFI